MEIRPSSTTSKAGLKTHNIDSYKTKIKYAFEKIFLDSIENHYLDIKEIYENVFEWSI